MEYLKKEGLWIACADMDGLDHFDIELYRLFPSRIPEDNCFQCHAKKPLIPKRRSVGLNATVGKTSAGAVEYVPVARVTNIVKTMEYLNRIPEDNCFQCHAKKPLTAEPAPQGVMFYLKFLCRTTSYISNAAATEAFSEEIFPYIGIDAVKSQFSRTRRLTPSPFRMALKTVVFRYPAGEKAV